MHLLQNINKCGSQLRPLFFQKFFSYVDNESLVKIYTRWTEAEKLKLKEACEKHKGDWRKIAEEVGTRGVRQCQLKLINFNAGSLCIPWTTEEDTKLISLVEKYGKKWSKIKEHFPGKSYSSIYSRYVLRLDPNLNKNELTLEERQKLCTIYKQYPERWHKIAKIMNSGHSQFFLRNSFYKFGKDLFKKGRFTPEEDTAIISFVSKNGKRWTALGISLNRYSNRIQSRYENVLDPQLVKGKWSNEEEEHLLTYVQENGKRWRTYSELTNRGYDQIFHKYHALVKRMERGQKIIHTLDEKAKNSC